MVAYRVIFRPSVLPEAICSCLCQDRKERIASALESSCPSFPVPCLPTHIWPLLATTSYLLLICKFSGDIFPDSPFSPTLCPEEGGWDQEGELSVYPMSCPKAPFPRPLPPNTPIVLDISKDFRILWELQSSRQAKSPAPPSGHI